MNVLMEEAILGKLQGEEIPFLARITAVADAFDAMTSKRSYRDSLSLDFVKEEILRNSGTQFDPDIAKVFLDILDNQPEEKPVTVSTPKSEKTVKTAFQLC